MRINDEINQMKCTRYLVTCQVKQIRNLKIVLLSGMTNLSDLGKKRRDEWKHTDRTAASYHNHNDNDK